MAADLLLLDISVVIILMYRALTVFPKRWVRGVGSLIRLPNTNCVAVSQFSPSLLIMIHPEGMIARGDIMIS